LCDNVREALFYWRKILTAKVLADSITESGKRLTTLEVTIRRFVLAEFNTHRVFSRNSASSRAIPIDKQIKRVRENPALPVFWGANQKGMSAAIELEGAEKFMVQEEWLAARDSAVSHVNRLLELGLHKQLANRLLEPWMWQTIIVTATEWDNYYALRCDAHAQPEIRVASEDMLKAMEESTPSLLKDGEWHLPLINPEDRDEADGDTLLKVSAGRCARVSYLTHDGTRDLSADVSLHDTLSQNGHMSPLEHQARPMRIGEEGLGGNFVGWTQYRKTLPNESNYGLVKEDIGASV
jgi:hypothetical protein